jgi:hypothetical protein
LAIKWKDIRDVFFLTTAHEDVFVAAPSSRGAHKKMKPSAVLDYNKYKTSVDRSDQMLSYYSFERKTIKWWKKLFFRLFDLVVVNARILHNKTSKKKRRWKFSMKKSPKDCWLVLVLKCMCNVRPAVQLADLLGETIFYIGFQRHMLRWREIRSAHAVCVQREANARPGGAWILSVPFIKQYLY